VRIGDPGRKPFCAPGLDDVVEVLADDDALIGRGRRSQLEHVGKDVVLRVVVDDVDRALAVAVERAEHRDVVRLGRILADACAVSPPRHLSPRRQVAGALAAPLFRPAP